MNTGTPPGECGRGPGPTPGRDAADPVETLLRNVINGG